MKKLSRIGSFLLMLITPVLYARADSNSTNPTIKDITLINPLGEKATIIGILDNIFTKALEIVLVIVPIIVIIGAFQMMFATGDPEKFKKGQKTILYAVIGLIIVAMARGIVAIVKSLLTV